MKNNKKISIGLIEYSVKEEVEDCKLSIEKNKIRLKKIEDKKSLLIKEYYNIEKRISSLNRRAKEINLIIDNLKEFINKKEGVKMK